MREEREKEQENERTRHGYPSSRSVRNSSKRILSRSSIGRNVPIEIYPNSSPRGRSAVSRYRRHRATHDAATRSGAGGIGQSLRVELARGDKILPVARFRKLSTTVVRFSSSDSGRTVVPNRDFVAWNR